MAGKGDMARPCDRRKYEAGYDKIDWGKKGKRKEKVSDDNVFKIVPLPPGNGDYLCHLDLAKGVSQSAVQMLQVPASLLNKN